MPQFNFRFLHFTQILASINKYFYLLSITFRPKNVNVIIPMVQNSTCGWHLNLHIRHVICVFPECQKWCKSWTLKC